MSGPPETRLVQPGGAAGFTFTPMPPENPTPDMRGHFTYPLHQGFPVLSPGVAQYSQFRAKVFGRQGRIIFHKSSGGVLLRDQHVKPFQYGRERAVLRIGPVPEPPQAFRQVGGIQPGSRFPLTPHHVQLGVNGIKFFGQPCNRPETVEEIKPHDQHQGQGNDPL